MEMYNNRHNELLRKITIKQWYFRLKKKLSEQ